MLTTDMIDVFQDTQSRIEADEELMEATEKSIAATKLYDAGFCASARTVKSTEWNVKVVEGSTLDSARLYAEGRVAALNFANPYEPGGGVTRGARAQEECLCRCSNLYRVLATEPLAESYYIWHQKHTDYLFSDKVIYTPEIQVIKSDDYAPLETPFVLDVISCAAPYNIRNFDRELLRATYESRITNILEAAIEHDADTVVLGAFGCGAFHNPAELMAGAFCEILGGREYYKYFKSVVFAILNTNRFKSNLTVFEEKLAQA